MRLADLRLLACAALICTSCGSEPSADDAAPYVIVISIDGLTPSTYTTPGPTQVATLRALARQGAWAEGVVGVLPANTYPSHATLLTGVPPAQHGIVNNQILDVDDTGGGSWYWYAREITAPTITSAVKARGITTAAVNWPTTVDADIDYLVPEFGAVYAHPVWLDLIRALSHPRGLLDTFEAHTHALRWPIGDDGYASIASWIFRTYRPHLMLVHLLDVDDVEHTTGPDSPEARAAVEAADRQVSQILEAVSASGLASRTNIVVVSDHGFVRTEQELRPNALFLKERLLEEDDYGRVRNWKAYFQSSGGSGFVMLNQPADAALRERVRTLLHRLASDPANGIETVWEKDDLERMGADPRAVFGLDMKDEFYTGNGLEPLRTRSGARGGHGYGPAHAAMNASLIMRGPNVGRAGNLGVTRMTQLAPTMASWFDVTLSPTADRALDIGAAK